MNLLDMVRHEERTEETLEQLRGGNMDVLKGLNPLEALKYGLTIKAEQEIVTDDE